MAKDRYPVTPAVRVLRTHGVSFTAHLIDYVERGGTAHTAATLGVDEHKVIKTLVFEDDTKDPLIILMHGDRQVSGRDLARQLGRRVTTPCDPALAERHTGYQVGGTSPFGTHRDMPVFIERTILQLPKIIVNGGKRGFLVELDPKELVRVLAAVPVDVAIAG
jgi:Cys-tRNA(Pro) deacylase